MEEFAGSISTGGGRWQALAGSSCRTVETVLLHMSEKDRTALLAEPTTTCSTACSTMTETLAPGDARISAENFLLNVKSFAMVSNLQGNGLAVSATCLRSKGLQERATSDRGLGLSKRPPDKGQKTKGSVGGRKAPARGAWE